MTEVDAWGLVDLVFVQGLEDVIMYNISLLLNTLNQIALSSWFLGIQFFLILCLFFRVRRLERLKGIRDQLREKKLKKEALKKKTMQ